MAYLLYNTLITIFLIFTAPYFLFRALIDGQFRKELAQRMGFFPNLLVQRPIWVHAASVGEVFCCIPLLKRIKQDFPRSEIVVTTMTRAGHEAAKTQIPEADAVLFFPIDHPLSIRRAIAKIQPSLLLIAETELWPNLLRSCGEKGIPIVLFNGRISQKSFRRYLFLKFFFKGCLKPISAFLMQTKEDSDRVIGIGALPEKTRVLGNLKFDQTFPTVTQEGTAQTAKSFGYRGNEKILIAGSTHAGEEEILLNLFKDLRKIDPHLIFLLAPRHLDRLGEVERILDRESIPWRKRTWFAMNQDLIHREKNELPWVILLDTMGELMSLYSLGTLVFVGGSLVPVGGHNPLEPLFFKKCVLFGPYMFHFSEISRSLTEAGGAIQVTGREDLFLHLKRLLSDERARKEMGEKGFQFLLKHQGATERVFKEIRPFLI
jgi:3-deoxy-D-manno-octulosonic-acid transferase